MTTHLMIQALTAVISRNNGFFGTVAWNADAGGMSSALKNENAILGTTIGGVSSGAGYWVGKGIEMPLDGLFNAVHKKYATLPLYFGISKFHKPSIIPPLLGNYGNSVIYEVTNKEINEWGQDKNE